MAMNVTNSEEEDMSLKKHTYELPDFLSVAKMQ